MSILEQDPSYIPDPDKPSAIVDPDEVVIECLDMRRYGLGNEVVDPECIAMVEYQVHGTTTVTNEKGTKESVTNYRIKMSLTSGVLNAYDVTDEEKAQWLIEEVMALKNKILAHKYRR